MHPLIQILEGEDLSRYVDTVREILGNVRGSHFAHVHDYKDLFEKIVDNIPNSNARLVIGDDALGISKQSGLPQIFYISELNYREKREFTYGIKTDQHLKESKWEWVSDADKEGFSQYKHTISVTSPHGSFSRFEVFLKNKPLHPNLDPHFQIAKRGKISPKPDLQEILNNSTSFGAPYLYNMLENGYDGNQLLGKLEVTRVNHSNVGYILFPWTNTPKEFLPFIQEHQCAIGVFPYSSIGEDMHMREFDVPQVGFFGTPILNPKDMDVNYKAAAYFSIDSALKDPLNQFLIDNGIVKRPVIL